MSETKTRTRRTTEQIIADLDAKIAYHKRCIDNIEEQKKAASAPRKVRQRKASVKQVVDAMKAAEIDPEEVLKMISKAAAKKTNS